MKSLLICGAEGFIGKNCLEFFAKSEDKYKITATYFNKQPESRLSNVEYVQVDLRVEEQVKELLKGKDIVIHLAAIVGFPACRMNPQLAKDVNVQGTKNLIESAQK